MSKTEVFIDSNAWNTFFQLSNCMCKHLPPKKYSFCINREVTFEINAIPKNGKDKKKLIQFIKKCINCCVSEQPIFGFADPALPPEQQRVGGFDQGRFAQLDEEIFRKELNNLYLDKEKQRPETKLYKNEADIDLAVRSIHGIVITNDIKKGPLREAHNRGYNIVYLDKFTPNNDNLEQYIVNQLQLNKRNLNAENLCR